MMSFIFGCVAGIFSVFVVKVVINAHKDSVENPEHFPHKEEQRKRFPPNYM